MGGSAIATKFPESRGTAPCAQDGQTIRRLNQEESMPVTVLALPLTGRNHGRGPVALARDRQEERGLGQADYRLVKLVYPPGGFVPVTCT